MDTPPYPVRFSAPPARSGHRFFRLIVALPILRTSTFDEAPDELEVLFVPGGFQGTGAMIEDPDVLDFVASRGERARGALVGTPGYVGE